MFQLQLASNHMWIRFTSEADSEFTLNGPNLDSASLARLISNSCLFQVLIFPTRVKQTRPLYPT